MTSHNGVLFPVIGQSQESDYNIVQRQFNVPIVLKEELIQCGGNTIEEYVPPTIQFNDGTKKTEYVLTTNAALDIYRVERYGTAIIYTTPNNQTILPEHSYQSTNVLSFPIVPMQVLAERGLMNITPTLPFISLRVNPDNPPAKYYVLSNEAVLNNKLTKVGTFNLPVLNKNGPNPLVLHQEKFAIPPSGTKAPSKTSENMTASKDTQNIIFIVIGILGLGLLIKSCQ